MSWKRLAERVLRIFKPLHAELAREAFKNAFK